MSNALLVKIQNEILLVLIVVVALLLIIIFVSFSELSGYKFIKTCHSFGSQKDAQESLWKYPNLDKNKDGIACNNL